MGSGGGGGGQNTTTQVQQIPAFEQQFAQENQDIARSIAAQPYQQYQGQLIAGFSPMQQQGLNMLPGAAQSGDPAMQMGQQLTANSAQPWNAQAVQQYMSPYAMAAMAPQLQQLQLQQAQQAKNIDANATQAGAFGDARNGVNQALNNFYGNLAQNDLVAQGMNTAYNTGLGAFQQGQQQQLAAGGQLGQMGNMQQQMGLTGANAIFGGGSQQQQLNQQQLTEAYNNFMNQVNYPQQMLNTRLSALSNSPYNTMQYQTLAPANATAQNLGAASALTGAIGNLTGGTQNGAGGKVFGGS